MYRRLSPPLLLCRLVVSPSGFPKHPSYTLLPRFPHTLSSRNAQLPDRRLGFVVSELEELQSLKPISSTQQEESGGVGGERVGREEGCSGEVEISHPWPEWVELMERLLKKGYLERYGLQRGSSSSSSSSSSSRDANHIRTACLNFARDRFDLIRYFSRKDIHIIAKSGCPSLDRKVVNSGKRLRAHVGIEEGMVCSSCNLRGSCERAYVKAREDEGGRTVDIMRILLTYGLDIMTGSVENQLCLNKMVKESVRRLLNEMVEFSTKELDSNPHEVNPRRLSSMLEQSSGKKMPRSQIEVLMKQGDWICPKCNFVNFAKNIKCLRCNGISQEKSNKWKEDYEHLPLKKGDWICDKCNFLNFAKNTKCLQCNEKPPKRQLNPGEWECVSCNYINFRRNMVCLKCDWKRPKASNSGENLTGYQHGNQGHPSRPGITFVRSCNGGNEHDLQPQRPTQEVDPGFWSSGEDIVDDGTFTELKDFPVKGSKSGISQNRLENQRWEGDMSKGKGFLRGRVSEGEDDMSSVRYRSLDLNESSSDEEMAGWFGCKNKMTES